MTKSAQQVQELKTLITGLEEKLGLYNRIQQALVELLGPGVVQAKLDEMHVNDQRPRVEQEKLRTAEAVSKGDLEVSDIIDPESFVMAIEYNSRGAITNLRTQMAMPFVSEWHAAFIGKKVGDLVEVEAPLNGKVHKVCYKILEIYSLTKQLLDKNQVQRNTLN